MMTKPKRNLVQIFVSAVAVALILGVILLISMYSYNYTEEEALHELHINTQQIKNDLNLQIISDRENLTTMSNFAAKLHSDGEGYDVLLQSFKKIGLIDTIGILLPDDTFVTRLGTLDVSENISFAEEVKRSEIVTGKVPDITYPGRQVIRSSVPIVSNGETVGILCGMIELDTLNERFRDEVDALHGDLFVITGGNSEMIIDTLHKEAGKITALASLPFADGYSYEKLASDLASGNSGYSSFFSTSHDQYVYAHYAPLAFSDWMIMFVRPEVKVFEDAVRTGKYLIIMCIAVVLIMGAYLLFSMYLSKKRNNVFIYASRIRKRLLEAWRRTDSIYDALKTITEFSRARSTLFADGIEDHCFIRGEDAENEIRGDDRVFLVQKLMAYATSRKKEYSNTVQIIEIKADNALAEESPALYGFLKDNGISRIDYATVASSNAQTAVLAILNAKDKLTGMLLREIAVCLSMAVYNRKHLINTEAMALTDSLTGIANRMSYKQDSRAIVEEETEGLACIYVDVNELHYFNNKYGHAAGDQMLIFIAETLKNTFREGKAYRMGGDEFLILISGLTPGIVEKRISDAKKEIEEMKYHISAGFRFLDKGMNIEELVNEAEKLMNEDKAAYYQEISMKKIAVENLDPHIESISTGVKEVDACLSIMSMRYQGIYSVNLKTDQAMQILAPSYYFMMNRDENKFSDIIKQYIHDIARSEFQRMLLSFIDYEVIERQLMSGHNPRVSYVKVDGEEVMLSVYKSGEEYNGETIWIFEKTTDKE